MAPEPSVFPHSPLGKDEVQRIKGFVNCRSVVAAVVVHPASDDRVEHAGEVLMALIASQMQLPTPYLIAYCLGRLVAYRWIEAIEAFTPVAFDPSRLKGKTQKVELHMGISPPATIIPAVDDLRLLRMQLQLALS